MSDLTHDSMRTAFCIPFLTLALTAPALAVAQLPAPKQPAQPPLEITTLRKITLRLTSGQTVTYERAGTKPIQFRIGGDPTLGSAPWQTFTEGPTTSSVEGTTTWITGTMSMANNGARTSGTCSAGVMWRISLQFRIRNSAGQFINSAIRSDSACLNTGG